MHLIKASVEFGPKIHLARAASKYLRQSSLEPWGEQALQNENICICNDDVLFDTEQLFGYLRETEPRGIIGIHPQSFH